MCRGAADLDDGNYSQVLWPHNVKVSATVKTQADLFSNNAFRGYVRTNVKFIASVADSSEGKLSVLKMKIYVRTFSFKCGYICLFWHGNPFLGRNTKLVWSERRPSGIGRSISLAHSRSFIVMEEWIITRNVKYLYRNMINIFTRIQK